MLSWGRRGNERVTTNLLSALLIMLVRVKLASGSKKGARGGEGEGGRGHLFVGIDLCGGGAGDPPAAPPCPDGDAARRGRWALGRGRPGRPAARAAQPPGLCRCPVPLNSTKKGYACS